MFVILYSDYRGNNYFDCVSNFKYLKKFIKERKNNFIILAVYFKRDLPPNMVDFFV